MRRIISVIESLPKWCGLSVILAYSLLLAKFFLTITHSALNSSLLENNLISIFIKISYSITVLSGIVIWIVMTFLFHLTALLFNGNAQFKRFLFVAAYPYIVPVVMILIGLFLLNGVQIDHTKDVAVELANNASFKLAMNLINFSFIPYYIIIAILIRYVYQINFLKALASVVIPIAGVWNITELIKLI